MLHITTRQAARLACMGTTLVLLRAGHRRNTKTSQHASAGSKVVSVAATRGRRRDGGSAQPHTSQQHKQQEQQGSSSSPHIEEAHRNHSSTKSVQQPSPLAGLGLSAALLDQVARQSTAALLRPTLEKVEQAQQRFFFFREPTRLQVKDNHKDKIEEEKEEDERSCTGVSSASSSQSVFAWIEARYGVAMALAQDAEVMQYNALQRMNYGERINEEVEACRRTRRAHYEAKARELAAQYKAQLQDDRNAFIARRQHECEQGLLADCEQYVAAMKAFRVSHAKLMRTVQQQQSPPQREGEDDKDRGSTLSGSSNMEGAEGHTSTIREQVSTTTIRTSRNDGSNEVHESSGASQLTNKGTLLTLHTPDLSETRYANERYRHYEWLLEKEIEAFVRNRKAFYEELLHAQVVQHGSKLHEELTAYEASRAVVYEDKLRQETAWFARALDEHYVQCFLQCYARLAWQRTRRAMLKEGSIRSDGHRVYDGSGAMEMNEVAKTNENKKKKACEDNVYGLTLDEVLEVYKAETLAEGTRDAFLRVARRVACEEKDGLLPQRVTRAGKEMIETATTTTTTATAATAASSS